jgi:hypothetical protein
LSQIYRAVVVDLAANSNNEAIGAKLTRYIARIFYHIADIPFFLFFIKKFYHPCGAKRVEMGW